ncbi:DUF5403 family protein [Corynebacterium sp. zg-331]|uniref:DUF5403 family protein n=1 Tax=unclassified Corynebacterium TaxID=2624378 RepID=UPI00128AF399|nr:MULTISPECIES: DUF5403 family protein [unclassified Corynebacterium]MBC3186368.1 DUF5403 family protein [Corynebacterium sp. zg-331]MPV52855.1 hypothetical protein [Corynebacterium sp. zg331]
MAEVYKGAGTQMARMAGNHAIMDEAAEKLCVAASARAARHRDTGEYSGNFKTARSKSPKGRGVTDRVVYNDHAAALPIEYGHFTEKRDGSTGVWVPGQFNLLGALYGQ